MPKLMPTTYYLRSGVADVRDPATGRVKMFGSSQEAEDYAKKLSGHVVWNVRSFSPGRSRLILKLARQAYRKLAQDQSKPLDDRIDQINEQRRIAAEIVLNLAREPA